MTPITFLREVRDELKKVVWPSKQEVIRLTLVVIVVSLIVGLFLGGLDFLFVKIIETIVK
jgi:preprotein translocase subunit SecE